jgi:hypothetical protein
MAWVVVLIWVCRKQEYFREKDWTAQITLKPLQKFVSPRMPTASPLDTHWRPVGSYANASQG